MLPQTCGGNSSIEFFQHPDELFHEIGDVWRLSTSLEPSTERSFMIATKFIGGGGPYIKSTPNGFLILGPNCIFDAPILRQNHMSLNELCEAKGDMVSYYNKTLIDNMRLADVKRSGGQSTSGNKTFTGLTRLDGGVHTRRHIVSNTTTVGNFV